MPLKCKSLFQCYYPGIFSHVISPTITPVGISYHENRSYWILVMLEWFIRIFRLNKQMTIKHKQNCYTINIATCSDLVRSYFKITSEHVVKEYTKFHFLEMRLHLLHDTVPTSAVLFQCMTVSKCNFYIYFFKF